MLMTGTRTAQVHRAAQQEPDHSVHWLNVQELLDVNQSTLWLLGVSIRKEHAL